MTTAAALQFREIRFVFQHDRTLAFVFLEPQNVCPLGVAGWRVKSFPPETSALVILRDHVRACLDWAFGTPPGVSP